MNQSPQLRASKHKTLLILSCSFSLLLKTSVRRVQGSWRAVRGCREQHVKHSHKTSKTKRPVLCQNCWWIFYSQGIWQDQPNKIILAIKTFSCSLGAFKGKVVTEIEISQVQKTLVLLHRAINSHNRIYHNAPPPAMSCVLAFQSGNQTHGYIQHTT